MLYARIKIKVFQFLTLALLPVSLLSGCANPQQKASEQEALNKSIPVCFGEEDCATMWSAARRWVLSNSKFKMRHMTDDFIETENSVNNASTDLAFRVILDTPPQKHTKGILVSAWCNNMFGCVPKSFDSAMKFNEYVKASSIKGTIGVDMGEDLTIREVFSRSPAEVAGIRSADKIVARDSIPIASIDEWRLNPPKKGKKIVLTMMRDGQATEISVIPE
jgi:hypothetical protein